MNAVLAAALLAAVALTACSGRPAQDATGEEIYLQLCARCHGEGLGGGIGPALGAGSAAADEPDEFLRFTIVNGRGSMPSFSTTLDEDQVGRLVEYMREVQAGG